MTQQEPMYYSPQLFFKLLIHSLSPNRQIRRAAMIALSKIVEDYISMYFKLSAVDALPSQTEKNIR